MIRKFIAIIGVLGLSVALVGLFSLRSSPKGEIRLEVEPYRYLLKHVQHRVELGNPYTLTIFITNGETETMSVRSVRIILNGPNDLNQSREIEVSKQYLLAEEVPPRETVMIFHGDDWTGHPLEIGEYSLKIVCYTNFGSLETGLSDFIVSP